MPKFFLKTAAVIVLLMVFFIAARPDKSEKPVKNKVCCKEASGKNCGKKEKNAADDAILENVSRQFITTTPFSL